VSPHAAAANLGRVPTRNKRLLDRLISELCFSEAEKSIVRERRSSTPLEWNLQP
jgi:hypothetical protein